MIPPPTGRLPLVLARHQVVVVVALEDHIAPATRTTARIHPRLQASFPNSTATTPNSTHSHARSLPLKESALPNLPGRHPGRVCDCPRVTSSGGIGRYGPPPPRRTSTQRPDSTVLSRYRWRCTSRRRTGDDVVRLRAAVRPGCELIALCAQALRRSRAERVRRPDDHRAGERRPCDVLPTASCRPAGFDWKVRFTVSGSRRTVFESVRPPESVAVRVSSR